MEVLRNFKYGRNVPHDIFHCRAERSNLKVKNTLLLICSEDADSDFLRSAKTLGYSYDEDLI